jgi:predicted signal transduction protein with EAL and GGDEF domain
LCARISSFARQNAPVTFARSPISCSRKGLAELSKWPQDISLSFNLSAQDISNQAFILSLLGQIMESGISPARIEFEITETAVMSDLEASKELLAELQCQRLQDRSR